MKASIEKRVDQLEAGKDRRPFYPLHIYQHGVERVPEKPYYIGKDGKIPPMVIVHEAEVQNGNG